MANRPSIGELLGEARQRLRDASFEIPTREAGLLLSRTLGVAETSVLAFPERPVTKTEAQRFEQLVARRVLGEPVAYLLGEREFWGLDLFVDDRVLVPRPETEHMVEAALSLDLPRNSRVLDLCTGSGCVAIALASERPQWTVYASDISPAALAVTRKNVRRHQLNNVHVLASDLMRAISADFDLITANPPYLEDSDKPEMSIEVKNWEPGLALFPQGGDAMSVYRRLLTSPAELRTQTSTPVLFEIDSRRAQRVTDLALASGMTVSEVSADLAGRPRVVSLKTAASP